jgi:purine-binding chemotaxis protein CheW
MEYKPHLIFNINGLQYGINVSSVKEIFPLPELTPIAEAPIDFVGIINLRSTIVPVMDLNLRLGAKQSQLQIDDNLIVIEWEGLQIGAIVHSVPQVLEIDSTAIAMNLDYGRIQNVNPVFINGIAKLETEEILLLNLESLIRQPDALIDLMSESLMNAESGIGNEEREDAKNEKSQSSDLNDVILSDNEESQSSTTSGDFYQLYCPKATQAEKTIFKQRSKNLRNAIAEDIDITKQIPIAVIGLNGEYFGIELETVKEFTTIRNLTRIPCCPDRIVGNMNLRGEILTLVDIRSILNLPTICVKTGSKIVVVVVDDIVAALPIDEVFDVIYLDASKIDLLPVAVSSNGNEYLRGTVFYQQKVMGILNLSVVLTDQKMTVEEVF